MTKEDRSVTLRFLAEPTSVNFDGKVHGGSVMKWIDEAGYACATGWSGAYCVTVYVGGIRFYRPILVGHLVEVTAKIIYTGTSSIHIAVDVHAGDPKERILTKTTHCIIVFVALDEHGKPGHVKTWTPTSEKDRALEQYAKRLRELRRDIEDEMKPYIE